MKHMKTRHHHGGGFFVSFRDDEQFYIGELAYPLISDHYSLVAMIVILA